MVKNSTLLIVGNGFDVAHGLKTRYYDMRNVFQDSLNPHPDAFSDLFPENINEDFEWFNIEQFISDKLNRQYEIHNILGDELVEKYYIDFVENDFEDAMRNGDLEYIKEQSKSHYHYRQWNDYYEDSFKTMENMKKRICRYIEREWNYKKDLIVKNEEFDKVIKESSYIISYNYTKTEEIYSRKAIHIHSTWEKGFENISFGRYEIPQINQVVIKKIFDAIINKLNLKINGEVYDESLHLFEIATEYEFLLSGIFINDIFIKKPVNIDFKIINKITKINSIGFSWSKIDFFELKKIFIKSKNNLFDCLFEINDPNFERIKMRLISFGINENKIFEIR